MTLNAFVLDWTMDQYEQLKDELAGAQFVFEPEGETNHIRVAVPFEQVGAFAELCQKHLNRAVNYVDIQYPDQKTTVIIFQAATHFITNSEENEKVKTWAIQMGLPPEQADWGTSF